MTGWRCGEEAVGLFEGYSWWRTMAVVRDSARSWRLARVLRVRVFLAEVVLIYYVWTGYCAR